VRRMWLVVSMVLLLGSGPGAALTDPRSPVAAADSAAARLEWQRSLGSRLDAVLASRELKRARVAALVVRAGDGEVLYEHSADRALTPASNAKILTAIAALDTFGPSHHFATGVSSDEPPDADGAVEELFVRGGGDPALNNEDWWRLAAELWSQGLRRVRGDLVLDDSAFDRDRWHPRWGPVSARAYHAPVGALTANYGAFSVTVTPGSEVGDPVEVRVEPPVSYLLVSNRARTVGARSRRTVAVDREAGGEGELVLVTGAVRVGDPPTLYYRSVLDPTRYAGAVLRMQLEAVGIAAWDNGVEAMRARLVGLGLDPAEFSLVDGSGLSYQDKVTPRTLVQALLLARNSFRIGPEFVAALPIAAVDGTLEKRGDGAQGQARAKTGLLKRVTALSGYAHLGQGQVAVFSILANGYRVSDEKAMEALDRFVAELIQREVPSQ